jgi:hypothetical protein
MHKQCSRNVVKIEEKTEEKIGRNDEKTVVMQDKMVIKTDYAKVLKMLVKDDVQMLKRKVLTDVLAAKTINVKDRLIAHDLFKVTEKVTIRIDEVIVIVADINHQQMKRFLEGLKKSV